MGHRPAISSKRAKRLRARTTPRSSTTIGTTSLGNMSVSPHQHPMVRGSAEAAASASASATTLATGKTTGGAATTNALGTTGETIGAAGLDLAAPAFSTTVGLGSASTSLGRRRGRGEAGQRERGYKHGYGSWTRTVERVPRSRTRRTEPKSGSNSWIELVDTQRSRRMVQDGDWNPSNPPREGEWRSRAPASFAPQCSVRRPCHLVLSSSRSRSRLSH